jgi:hypothetical protein
VCASSARRRGERAVSVVHRARILQLDRARVGVIDALGQAPEQRADVNAHQGRGAAGLDRLK